MFTQDLAFLRVVHRWHWPSFLLPDPSCARTLDLLCTPPNLRLPLVFAPVSACLHRSNLSFDLSVLSARACRVAQLGNLFYQFCSRRSYDVALKTPYSQVPSTSRRGARPALAVRRSLFTACQCHERLAQQQPLCPFHGLLSPLLALRCAAALRLRCLHCLLASRRALPADPNDVPIGSNT